MTPATTMALEAGLQLALSAPPGPALAAAATQLQVAVQAALADAAVGEPDIGDDASGWGVYRSDHHAALFGPAGSVSVTLHAGQIWSLRVTEGDRSMHIDYGDHSQGDTAGRAAEQLLSGDLLGAAKRAVQGVVSGAAGSLGGIRVRTLEGAVALADWSFTPTGGAVDNHDLATQFDAVLDRLAGALESAGDPDEPEHLAGGGLTEGAGRLAGGTATGAVAAGAVAAAAARLAVRAAAQHQRQQAREAAAAEASQAAPGSASRPADVQVTAPSVAAPTVPPPEEHPAPGHGAGPVRQPRPTVPPPGGPARQPRPTVPPPGAPSPAAGPPVQPPPQSRPTSPPVWTPTHRIHPVGVDAREHPEPADPVTARLPGGLPVRLEQQWGDWALVTASNGWHGWIDGRYLVA